MNTRTYHHGDLRRALLTAAVAAIDESGPGMVSLRDLARRAGVSHAAPAHHFGDKAGLLTALAAEGYALLADALDDAYARAHSFAEAGAAYVRFAVEHRAHFEVMFRPDLYYSDDDAVVAARQRAGAALRRGVTSVRGTQAQPGDPAGIAAWSLAHGYATLVLTGNVAASDPAAAFADVAASISLRRTSRGTGAGRSPR